MLMELTSAWGFLLTGLLLSTKTCQNTLWGKYGLIVILIMSFFCQQRLLHTFLCSGKIEDLTASVFIWILQYILKYFKKKLQTPSNKCKQGKQCGFAVSEGAMATYMSTTQTHSFAVPHLGCQALNEPMRREMQEGVLEWTTDEKQKLNA